MRTYRCLMLSVSSKEVGMMCMCQTELPAAVYQFAGNLVFRSNIGAFEFVFVLYVCVVTRNCLIGY